MNIIKKQKHLGIDKNEIDELIAAKKFIGLNKKPRPEKVIVSLTSYKPRINDVKYTIYSLLNQNFPPDKLILWLDEDSFPQREKNLPQDLLNLEQFGLTIDWCENLRPYKKLIPALEKYPDDIIITADDDIFYRPDWLKILYAEHLKNPDCVIAHRANRVRFDSRGNLYPFKQWSSRIDAIATPPKTLYGNFHTSGAGALYKKILLHEDISKRELFLKLAPIADDIWFWAMTVLNGTKISIPNVAMKRLILVDIDKERFGITLWRENTGKGKQDVQLRQVFDHYPELLEKLIREDVESKPYISVVMPIKNSANLSARLENIFAQNFPDFELIVINLGARINLPTLPTNFRVINYPGGSLADALNLGLRKATGDYILFKDETSILPRDALDVIAQAAQSSADVIHFAGHIKLTGDNGKFILDDAPELSRELFNATKQIRAVAWLKNKLSKRLDTKIFRREFLTRNEIIFSKDISEFLFQALIHAEKYLLVPQAFCYCKD